MRAQKCRLILHGSYKQHDMGEFQSKAAAKKYVKECWDKPYTIIIINKKNG
jgi:tRNA A37 threonylcarbamoyladenosine synthetase subunit TsaC/SUA5/YrdC